MKEHGYRIIPVNPTADQILGEKAYPSLLDLPPDLARRVELVDIFRPSDELIQVAEQVVKMQKEYGRPFVYWAQLGLESEEAKKLLSKNNVLYVMNACVRVVHRRLTD